MSGMWAGQIVNYHNFEVNNPEVNMEDVVAYIDTEQCVELAFLSEEHKTLHFNFELSTPSDARLWAIFQAGYRMGQDYERNRSTFLTDEEREALDE